MTEQLQPLVARAQAGDLEAFGRIVDRFRDMAYGYAYSLLGDFELAADATQEAFVQAYRGLAGLRDPRAFPGWLKRIVFTSCTRATRGRRPATERLDSVAEVPASGPGPAELAEQRELQRHVIEAIGGLPNDERAVTTLFYINGYSHHEIADFLEVPLTTVKSRLHTSRRRLKERMLGMVSDYLQGHATPPEFTGRVLSDIPAGQAHTNSFAQGLSTILNYTGTAADYDTLMGDLGIAFIMQASEQTAVIDGAIDAGWWPLADQCLPTFLEFAGSTVGRTIHYLRVEDEVYVADPAACYRARFERQVRASIDAGRPVLANNGFWKVVSGYDDGDPGLLAHCPSQDTVETVRLDSYPWVVAVVGDDIAIMDRGAADLETLRHAVALGHDGIAMPSGYFTGQRAFALWARTLRDMEHRGEARWHANVVLHLGINRRSAVACLRAMVARRRQAMAHHLNAAADLNQQVLGLLETADTSDQALIESTEGRERLAQLAERIAGLESQAVAELEQAVRAAPGG
jgi:RNA polymerase sigma factor (sigma-70 family)